MEEIPQTWMKYLRNPFIQIAMPTEVVFKEPRIVVPKYARCYETDLYIYKLGLVLPYEELRKKEDFTGTAHHPSVRLCELWHDCGADGHMEMYIKGWCFIRMDKFNEDMLRWDTHIEYH